MADRAQISKITAHALTGQDDAAKISKIVAYLLLIPGDDSADTSNKQGHVHAQIIKRS